MMTSEGSRGKDRARKGASKQVQETFYGTIGVVGAHNVPQIRLGPEFKLGTKVRVTVTKVKANRHD